jgi:signal transduction histidine kinase/CheY-like chemotaxis protein
MTRFSSLRARLVGTVFLAVAPAWLLTYFIVRRAGSPDDVLWTFLAAGVGLMALAGAWFGGERFVLRHVRILTRSARLLAAGDLDSRTGLGQEGSELGDLGRTFDQMASALQQRIKERDNAEKRLLLRALQQTVISALGEFALVSNDLQSLLQQAVMLAAQSLEVEYCCLLELEPGRRTMLVRAGVGWKPGVVGETRISADPQLQPGFTLTAGEPVVVRDARLETRFRSPEFQQEHGVVSSITVGISGYGEAFGVLGAYTTRLRAFSEDEVHFLFSIGTVLAMAVARKNAEAQMEKLAAFARLNPNPAMELAADGSITYCNEAGLRLTRSIALERPRELLPTNIANLVQTALAGGPNKLTLETQVQGRTLAWSFHPVRTIRMVHAYVDDITERLNLQSQLRQSQKMECVGQLAAGVAHDFNNLLTIMQGHAGMLLAKSSHSPELLEAAQAIFFASERAANLTRQLLMFSRKNVMQPKALDLREVVSQMTRMLQRLLGETIVLSFTPPPRLPLVHADSGMIEQVIMNLAVNARDAMPAGGTLTISTSAVAVEPEFLPRHPEARLGSFVCLQVTDTGCGMDRATLARIFEPFFTTKEAGKGTGLGLATVYGIVKQHEGWIEVQSEPRRGTTFSLFFPAAEEIATIRERPVDTAEPVRGGTETILVVEDEPVIRELAQVILQDCGYQVLQAESGREALWVWEERGRAIDLVLTDVVMPDGISGMELAQRLLATNPNVKIIFASGYSMDNFDPEFVQKMHAGFLQKPYTHLTLARAVRECLDGKLEPAISPTDGQ